MQCKQPQGICGLVAAQLWPSTSGACCSMLLTVFHLSTVHAARQSSSFDRLMGRGPVSPLVSSGPQAGPRSLPTDADASPGAEVSIASPDTTAGTGGTAGISAAPRPVDAPGLTPFAPEGSPQVSPPADADRPATEASVETGTSNAGPPGVHCFRCFEADAWHLVESASGSM